MKFIESGDYYTESKFESYKADPNGTDEFDSKTKDFQFFNSMCGYMGMQDDCQNYDEIKKVVDNSIFGEIVKEAEKLSWDALGEYRKANPNRKGYYLEGEFDYKGIPCSWNMGVADGLSVNIDTGYLMDNLDKLNIEIPNCRTYDQRERLPNKMINFSKRLRKAFGYNSSPYSWIWIDGNGEIHEDDYAVDPEYMSDEDYELYEKQEKVDDDFFKEYIAKTYPDKKLVACNFLGMTGDKKIAEEDLRMEYEEFIGNKNFGKDSSGSMTLDEFINTIINDAIKFNNYKGELDLNYAKRFNSSFLILFKFVGSGRRPDIPLFWDDENGAWAVYTYGQGYAPATRARDLAEQLLPNGPSDLVDYGNFGYNDDSYEDDSYECFTPEEKALVTQACYIVSNINYAMRSLGRRYSASDFEPVADKAYRVLDDPTQSIITNELFDFDCDYKTAGLSKDKIDLVKSIMKKIRVEFKNAPTLYA